jgi:hypothetical protein
MNVVRSVMERVMPTVVPKTITDFAPPPRQLDTNLWTLERRARMPGGPVLPTTTTIVRLAGGDLVLVSPPPIECGGFEAVDALGRVRHLVLPNAFHHLTARGVLGRYPDAELWVSPGLFQRVPDLPAGTELAPEVTPPWSASIDRTTLQATPQISEMALFHHESATLVLTDLAFHLVRFERAFDRIAWRFNGVPNEFGHSRTGRAMLLRDPAVIAPFLDRVLAWPFRRILVAHGDVVEGDAKGTFRRAFADYLTAHT